MSRRRNPAAVRALLHSRTRPHHLDRVPPEDPAAPVQEPVVVPPPAGLVEAERLYWDIFAPLLAGAKVLTPADVETLADYCRACAAVDERGRRLRTAFKKKVLDNQTVRMLDSQMRGWVEKKTKLAGELGLTALSRTHVLWSGYPQTIDAKKKPQSTLARLQAQAANLKRPVGVK